MLENTMVRLVEIKHELIKYNTHTDHVQFLTLGKKWFYQFWSIITRFKIRF